MRLKPWHQVGLVLLAGLVILGGILFAGAYLSQARSQRGPFDWTPTPSETTDRARESDTVHDSPP